MRIDFYIIENAHPDALMRVAARLLEKVYAQNLRAWVLCSHLEEAKKLDNWLWAYKKNSFLPHALTSSLSEGEDVPIQISTETEAASDTFDLLLNVSESGPTTLEPFGRILDLVAPHQKESGRIRYRNYQTPGATIKTHNV